MKRAGQLELRQADKGVEPSAEGGENVEGGHSAQMTTGMSFPICRVNLTYLKYCVDVDTVFSDFHCGALNYLDSCSRVRNRGGRRQKQPAKEGALQGAFEGWRKEG